MTIARIGRGAISVSAAAIFVACGGPLGAPNSPPFRSGEPTSSHDVSGGCPLSHCIVVTSIGGKGKPPAAVLFFAIDANGNVSPAAEISGSKTMLSSPAGLAVDSRGNIYAADTYTNTITVYASGAQGNVAPIRTISGDKTKLNRPTGLAFDSKDELYVSDNQANQITVYARDAKGDAAPIRTISGNKTKLYAPWGIAFDSHSNLYVADDNPNAGRITVYAANAHGNDAPKRTIEGRHTKLAGPLGLTVDPSGHIYVVNASDYAVCIFAAGANGNEAPVAHFTSVLYGPAGIALGENNEIYVSNLGYDDPPFVAVFAAGTKGNKGALLQMIRGKKTELSWPEGIVVR